MEALAKFDEPIAEADRRCSHEVADDAGPASPFALWRLARADDESAVDRRAKLLQAKDMVTRPRAIHVLRRLPPKHPVVVQVQLAGLAAEPPDSPAARLMRRSRSASGCRCRHRGAEAIK